MPNKYRHIGIVISDGFVFFIVVVGPVVGRYAIDVADNWRFIYYGGMHFKVYDGKETSCSLYFAQDS
jgi:hypothetical protein